MSLLERLTVALILLMAVTALAVGAWLLFRTSDEVEPPGTVLPSRKPLRNEADAAPKQTIVIPQPSKPPPVVVPKIVAPAPPIVILRPEDRSVVEPTRQPAQPLPTAEEIAAMTALELQERLKGLIDAKERSGLRKLVLEILERRADAYDIFRHMYMQAATPAHEMVAAAALLSIYLKKGGTAEEPMELRDTLRYSIYPKTLSYLRQSQGDNDATERSLWILNNLIKTVGTDPEAVSVLTSKLAEEPADTRGSIAIMLGNARDPSALPVLSWIYSHETDPQARSFALWAIGNYDPAMMPDIIPIVRRAMTEQNDINATITMARWGEKEAGPLLVKDLPGYSNDQYDGIIVSTALVKLNDPELIPSLKGLLTSGDPNTRINAAMILGHYGDASGTETLRQTVADAGASERLRTWSIFALAKLGDPAMIPELERLAASPEQATASNARNRLESLRAKQ